MSDTDAMQQRITAALDRISQGLEGVAQLGDQDATVDARALEAVQQELADEKLTHEQVRARLKKVQKQHEAENSERQEKDQAMANLDTELQSLRQANQQLRDNNQALRKANEAGLADADLIDKAAETELAALRADQAAGRAEVDVVLSDLAQLIGNAAGDDSKTTQAGEN